MSEKKQIHKKCVIRSSASQTSSICDWASIPSSNSQLQLQQQQNQSSTSSPVFVDGIAASAMEIEQKLNELYEKRLAEINEQANGDAMLKEITYQEWIAMLRQTNKTLITNIHEMDRETTNRLALLQQKSETSCRQEQCIETIKFCRDRDNLVRFIRKARQTDDWNVDGLRLETMSAREIFGEPLAKQQSGIMRDSHSDCLKRYQGASSKSNCKLMTHLKALAFEIAERHDEMRDLKRQIISLEDDILNAQKKIQLKDDVIRELRNDLKTFPKSNVTWDRRVSVQLSPVDCCPPMLSEPKICENAESDIEDTPRGDSFQTRDSIHSLNFSECSFPYDEEDYEELLIKGLREELNQLFEIQECCSHQKRRDIIPRLNKMVDELVKIKHDLQTKLRFYRQELSNLDNPELFSRVTDEDSGISTDVETDAKIVNRVRTRLNCLLCENRHLKQDDHRKQIEMEDLASQLRAKSLLLDKTSQALKEVADTISIATSKPIQYEKIFDQSPNITRNPIVEAFSDLLHTLADRDKLIRDLRAKMNNPTGSNEQRQTSSETAQSQSCENKSSMNANCRNEKIGKVIENPEFTRTLFKKNEELKNLVCRLEQRACSLEKQIEDIQQESCLRCEERDRRDKEPRQSKSDEQLEKLDIELKRKCRLIQHLTSENDLLKQELMDIQKNRARTKYSAGQQQLPPKPSQNSQQLQELMAKLSAAEERICKQQCSLKDASRQLTFLKGEIEELQTTLEVNKKERELLQSELTALKEYQAAQMGIEQSLKEQIQRTTCELYSAKNKVAECKQERHRIENLHREKVRQLQEDKVDVLRKYNALTDDYNSIHEEYLKLLEINNEKSKIISALDEWKQNQVEIDRETQFKKALFEKHIRDMLEDKQKLLDQLQETENINYILKETLENTRLDLSGSQQCSGPLRGNKTSASILSQDDRVSKVIESVRNTTRKLSHQRSILEEEAACAMNT